MNKAGKLSPSVKTATGMALGAILLYALCNSMLNVVVNEVVNGFSLTGASEGLMSSMFSVGTMLALLAAPLMQGRIGKITVLLLGTALQTAMLLLCGGSPIFALFCISCVFLGVGGGLVDSYTNSILVDVHKEESTRYLGYLHGLFGVGSLLAPLLFLQVLGWTSWRGAFFVLAGVLLVGLVALLALSRRMQRTEMEQATQESVLSLHDLREYVTNPRNLAVLASAVFATATQTGVLAWVVRYMALRFDAEALGTTSVSLFWVCATINRFSISKIRMEPIRLFVIGAGLAALCLGIGILSNSAWGMCIAMGVLGLCVGHFMQVLFRECTKGYEGKTTFATSLMIVVMGLTRSVLPLVMAWVSTSFSVVAGMLIPAVTAIGAVLSGTLLARANTRLAALPTQGEAAK